MECPRFCDARILQPAAERGQLVAWSRQYHLSQQAMWVLWLHAPGCLPVRINQQITILVMGERWSFRCSFIFTIAWKN